MKCAVVGISNNLVGWFPTPDERLIRATCLRKHGAGHLKTLLHNKILWHTTEISSNRGYDRYFGYHVYLKTDGLSNITGLSPLLDFTHSVFLAVSWFSASALPNVRGGREHPQARGRISLPADVTIIHHFDRVYQWKTSSNSQERDCIPNLKDWVLVSETLINGSVSLKSDQGLA